MQKYSEINSQLFRCMVSREDWHDWLSRVPCVDNGTNRCSFHVHAVAVDKVDGGMEVWIAPLWQWTKKYKAIRTLLLMDKHLAPVDIINTPPKTNISMEKYFFLKIYLLSENGNVPACHVWLSGGELHTKRCPPFIATALSIRTGDATVVPTVYPPSQHTRPNRLESKLPCRTWNVLGVSCVHVYFKNTQHLFFTSSKNMNGNWII